MKILLLGGNGSIGRRYASILDHLNLQHVIADDVNGVNLRDYDFDRAIVCTPTVTHHGYAKKLIAQNIPVLIEKPLSFSEIECREIVEVSKDKAVNVVCNYLYVVRKLRVDPPYKIKYDYFHTGSENLYWNTCQLVYLDPDALIRQESPKWSMNVNGKWVLYRLLENSYIDMIRDWVSEKYNRLWSVEDGLKMTQTVLKRMK